MYKKEENVIHINTYVEPTVVYYSYIRAPYVYSLINLQSVCALSGVC